MGMGRNRDAAFAERDADAERLTGDAQRLLVGNTIVHAQVVPHTEGCDSANVLRLTLDNGKVIDIEGSYGGYTGESCDEYVERLSIEERATENGG
jgi:hypothetical protein